jgi:phosphatidate cytidylyltransferase
VNAVLGRVLSDSAPAVRSARWADLRLRLASALVLGPLALACVWYGGMAWILIVAVAGLGVCWEWVQMAKREPGALAVGLAYCGLAIAALGWLRMDAATGRTILLFLLFVVWSSDVGAYVAGRLIGGRKLAPSISPGKTWSGAAGGLAAAIMVGIVGALLWRGPIFPAILAAAALGIASQLGDLLESGAKRRFGVKDSGKLIPGHGGLLDRLDGLMAAALLAGGWILVAGLGWMTGQGAAAWP